MTRRILVVAMANSVHTLRWLQMVNSAEHRVVLLPCTDMPVLPAFAALPRVRDAKELDAVGAGQLCLWADTQGPSSDDAGRFPLPIGWPHARHFVQPGAIVRAVRTLQPDMVHSLEVQHSSYPCLAAAQAMGDSFPAWLVSNWGSDLYLYEKLQAHRPVLQALMGRIDALHSECRRDGAIAHGLGYPRERPQYFMPATGGEDMARLPIPRHPPSARDILLIKGYHGWSGRAQHVMSALLMAAPKLAHLKVRVVLANESVAAMAEEVARTTGLDVRAEPWSDDSAVAVQRTANARIAVGIGISDGIGTSFLEAMALGAFPVAASTACACEWVRDGVDGAVVDPHDVRALAEALIRAANDDELVDAASVRNRRQIETRWNVQVNRPRALSMYRSTMGIEDECPQQ